ncbi:hypothetical protein TNCV_480581 [Trichonephila clavipes]|nr:hypothetical protein TNCV_480581 [Trichonephila clavipes]
MFLRSGPRGSAEVSSIRALGSKDIQAPLTLEDRNLQLENLVKSSLSRPFWVTPHPRVTNGYTRTVTRSFGLDTPDLH